METGRKNNLPEEIMSTVIYIINAEGLEKNEMEKGDLENKGGNILMRHSTSVMR